MKSRRTFTKEFKLSILRELESKPAAEVSREHNVHPVLLSIWKRDSKRILMEHLAAEETFGKRKLKSPSMKD